MTAMIMIAIGFAGLACGLLAGFLMGHVQGQQQACDKWMQVLREKEEELRKMAVNAPLHTYHKPQWLDNADSKK